MKTNSQEDYDNEEKIPDEERVLEDASYVP